MATNRIHLLLASQSPRRRELLTLLSMPFQVTSPDIVEIPQVNEAPFKLVTRLSQAKARAACSEIDVQSIGIIIACDTVVALDNELLGKPRDAAEATMMLRRLREQPTHDVYSAVTLLEPATDRVLTTVAKTQLMMRAYTDAEIAAYVASGDPMDKAGAYAIQHPGFRPVATLQGCYANVVGLPLCHLVRCLYTLGIKSPHDVPAACQTHTHHHCPVYASILNDK
ncbi:MAG: septum formation protein Maf [Chloroflexi bacterium]|nr:septum formation protein Maf [Chloroflexota bacterium]